MKKYVCSVCGYVYDEAAGDPGTGIAPGTRWEDVPEDWLCPLCGAAKSDFNLQQDDKQEVEAAADEDDAEEEMHELSFGELSALCSNLSKGCEKQYRTEEAELFNQLAQYYKGKVKPTEGGSFEQLISLAAQDSDSYARAGRLASAGADRGALRAVTWGEKVTKILTSLLSRYEKQKDALLESTNVFVCEICGFIYIGDEAPEVCPVCKVPKQKIAAVKRGEV